EEPDRLQEQPGRRGAQHGLAPYSPHCGVEGHAGNPRSHTQGATPGDRRGLNNRVIWSLSHLVMNDSMTQWPNDEIQAKEKLWVSKISNRHAARNTPRNGLAAGRVRATARRRGVDTRGRNRARGSSSSAASKAARCRSIAGCPSAASTTTSASSTT